MDNERHTLDNLQDRSGAKVQSSDLLPCKCGHPAEYLKRFNGYKVWCTNPKCLIKPETRKTWQKKGWAKKAWNNWIAW